jgi:translocation and assembly module TamA
MKTSSIVKNLICIALLALPSTIAWADEITYDISGVPEPMLTNVKNYVAAFRLTSSAGRSNASIERFIGEAENRARAALRPYGYYAPVVESVFNTDKTGAGKLVLKIDAGSPVLVSIVDVQIAGAGKNYAELRKWHAAWPLPVGAVLDQTLWEGRKQAAIEIATARGYLQAEFSTQSIEVDLTRNIANLTLVFDTGKRSVMGEVSYEQDILKPYVLDNIPRFSEGDPYTAYLMDKFRTDLWKTGYFTDVEVIEKPRADVDPPVVDLQVTLKTETRNTYQGMLGVGSDSGVRLQTSWSRHPVSSSGDHLDMALGWTQKDNEFLFRPTYRIPRRNALRQYWIAELPMKTEQRDFEFKQDIEDEDKIRIASGRVNDFLLKGGRLKVRNLKASGDQAFETIFAQFLHEDRQLDLLPDLPPGLEGLVTDPDFDRRLQDTTQTLAFGLEWDRPSVRGKGFETVGRRDKAWLLASNAGFGSDVDFMQLYASTHRNYVVGDRWKFLLRAEAGYTDAKVDNYSVMVGGQTFDLGITRLPDFYRFKAGGSRSVRGYSFEGLSDHDLGSNNIFTASAELEMRFLKSWSAAVFYDIGNAFNDWSEPDLRKGVGFGIRWYSLAGAIRVDYARAEDLEGKPWRLHFTIGIPLL